MPPVTQGSSPEIDPQAATTAPDDWTQNSYVQLEGGFLAGVSLGHLLCEESIRLVEADDDDDAQRRATEIGVQSQHEYLNEEGQTVRWRFGGVLEIQDLCEAKITHGVEVFSKMFRRSQS